MSGFRGKGKGREVREKSDLKGKYGTKVEEYYVEEILGKRTVHGKVKYLVKWRDWPSSANTWEPIGNLRGSEQFVAEFEAADKTRKALCKTSSKAAGRQTTKKRPYATVEQVADSDDEAVEDTLDSEEVLSEIPAGKVPRKIIGGTTILPNTIALLVKWGNENEADEDEDQDDNLKFIYGKVMNAIYPQMVIRFYEGCTTWVEDKVEEDAGLSHKK